MTPPPTPVPDLLKRFTATPYKLIAQGFVVETNDLDLLEQFDQRAELDALAAIARNFHIRVVRESELASSSEEIRAICTDSVCAVLVGMGTIIMVDREQRRVLSFVASNISQQRFAHTYLPMAIHHAGSHPHPATELIQRHRSSPSESLQTSDKSDNRV
jgi:hypothetical protein